MAAMASSPVNRVRGVRAPLSDDESSDLSLSLWCRSAQVSPCCNGRQTCGPAINPDLLSLLGLGSANRGGDDRMYSGALTTRSLVDSLYPSVSRGEATVVKAAIRAQSLYELYSFWLLVTYLEESTGRMLNFGYSG